MKAIVCELCGSNQLIKKDGFYQCEYCGTEYILDDENSGKPSIHLQRNDRIDDIKRRVNGCLDRLLTSLIIPPSDFMGIIQTFIDSKECTYKTNDLKEGIQEYINSFGSKLSKYNVRPIELPKSWDVKCTTEATGLSTVFLEWLYFDTSLLSGEYNVLKKIQEKITVHYEKLIEKGITILTSYGLKCNYPYNSFNYMYRDLCEKQWSSVFGADVTKENLRVELVPICNIYLRNLFIKGINNAEKINKIIPEEMLDRYAKKKYLFFLGRFYISYEEGSNDYGPRWSYKVSDKSFESVYKEFFEQKKISDIIFRKKRKICQYCGGSFKGVFSKVCSKCGKPKDY